MLTHGEGEAGETRLRDMASGDDWPLPLPAGVARLRILQRLPKSIARQLRVAVVPDGEELKILITARTKRRKPP